MRILIITIMWLLSSMPVFPQVSGNDSRRKPDLIIKKVRMERILRSGPLLSGPRYKFTLTIQNIGDTLLAKPFYISFSTSQKNFETRYCDHTSMVNYPVDTIFQGSFLDVVVNALIRPQTSKVFFVINTNNSCGRGPRLPEIEELDYSNNWFDFTLKELH